MKFVLRSSNNDLKNANREMKLEIVLRSSNNNLKNSNGDVLHQVFLFQCGLLMLYQQMNS